MKKRSTLILVAVLLLLGGIGTLGFYTFSRYTSTATGSDTAKVAPWVVKVNGDDIVLNNTFTSNDITWSESEYISDGYIAPSRTGEFGIVIDPSGSKVAMEYSVVIDESAMANYSQINITGVKVGGTALTEDANGAYTGIITLEEVEANTTKSLTVSIEWTNSEANNESDTTIGSTIDEIQIPVTVTVSQYLG